MIPAEITSPLVGEDMRASWGAAVAHAVNAHGAELQDLRRPGEWRSLRVEAGTAPVPFEVRRLWVSESGGAGKVAKWCIYLPANCLHVGADAVDATTGLAAPDGAAAGWYELPEFTGEDGAGAAYLHVTLPYAEESGSGTVEHDAEAEVVAEAETPGEHDMYVELAVIGDGGVAQKVVGALVIGSGSGVTSLNELAGDVVIEGGDGVEVEEEGQTIRISLSDEGEDGEGDGESVYCNAISEDGEGGAGGNGISGFGGGGGGGDGIDNDISNWPCDSGVDEGETT